MPGFSIWHLLIAGLIVLVLFGGKFKFSDIAGDAAKGIKAFKEGLKDETDDKKADSPKVENKDDAKS